MPTIYLEDDDPAWNNPLTDNWARHIPYKNLADRFFKGDRQQLIPFLGAGASMHSSGAPLNGCSDKQGDSVADFEELCGRFGIKQPVFKNFLRMSVLLAQRLERQVACGQASLKENAPSAYELSALLAAAANYDHLRRPARKIKPLLPELQETELMEVMKVLAERTAVANTVPPLLSIASYFNHVERRKNLWETLHARFVPVTKATETHKLIARAAEEYIKREPMDHYLIVTTNYDRLMESALLERGVPACVVTVDNLHRHVYTRFSPLVKGFLSLSDASFQRLEKESCDIEAGDFWLSTRRGLAMVYKMHGCLEDSERDRDSVIISDQDYVSYIEENGIGLNIIPKGIKKLIGYAPLLFLGYSFSDWNVRSLYMQLERQRNNKSDDLQDYAVLKSLDPYDQTFFDEKHIAVIMTGLDDFARKMRGVGGFVD